MFTFLKRSRKAENHLEIRKECMHILEIAVCLYQSFDGELDSNQIRHNESVFRFLQSKSRS